MEIFRHIRENHLTEIKKLNIKIGKPPESDIKKPFRRPGPRSRTRMGFKPASLIQEPSSSDTQQPCSSKVSEQKMDVAKEETSPAPPQDPIEEMDFESAINSIGQMSQSDIEEQQQLVLTVDETSLTLNSEL